MCLNLFNLTMSGTKTIANEQEQHHSIAESPLKQDESTYKYRMLKRQLL